MQTIQISETVLYPEKTSFNLLQEITTFGDSFLWETARDFHFCPSLPSFKFKSPQRQPRGGDFSRPPGHTEILKHLFLFSPSFWEMFVPRVDTAYYPFHHTQDSFLCLPFSGCTVQCTSLQPLFTFSRVILYSVHLFNLCLHSLEVYSPVYMSSTSVFILQRYTLQSTYLQPLFTFSRGI